MLTLEQQQIIALENNVEITMTDIAFNEYMGIIENKTGFAVFILDLNKSKRYINVFDSTGLEISHLIEILSDTTDPHNLERCIRLAIKLLQQI